MGDDFKSRLESAISRGQRRGQRSASDEAQKKLSEEEIRSLHTSYRLSLSERIETNVQNVVDHFPGFVSNRCTEKLAGGPPVSGMT